MERLVLNGGPGLEVVVKRSRRSRRLSLRVSRLDGTVSLTMPAGLPLSAGAAFLDSRESWVRDQVSQAMDMIPVAQARELPFEGRGVSVTPAKVKSVTIKNDGLVVPEDPQRIAPALLAFYKHAARRRLQGASEHYAGLLGRDFGKVTLRDTRSRWGSCTSDGNLMYSWRLIMCPPEVLDYVAAHEVCHLKHMNHSDAFWGAVRDVFGAYEDQRHWLRVHGPALHRYRFADKD